MPLRRYHSRKVANRFLAGPNTSATHIACAGTRVTGIRSVRGGQAIGTAVAFWKDPADSDIATLSTPKNIGEPQQGLLKDDTYLNRLANTDEADLARVAPVRVATATSVVVPAKVLSGVTRTISSASGTWAQDKGPC